MTLKLRKLVVCASLVLAGYAALLSPSSLAAADESPDKSAFTRDNSAPVYVKSDQLTLKARERIFEYHGNVQAIQADLTIWADHLAGTYGEDNEIQTLTATKNVLVEKGENIRATGQKAIF